MNTRALVTAGGISLIGGALSFVVVFAYLAANFDYPDVLDGAAVDVLPRLRAGGATMRATWAVYACLPLLLIVGAFGTRAALPARAGAMALASAFATVGALAMCLGLMRWPSVHWTLAAAYEAAGNDGRQTLGAVFSGLNLYLGNYVGEFLGEVCLGAFFLLSGFALRAEPSIARWPGPVGIAFALSFLIGAWRNVVPSVQPLADVNNYLLPAWMIVLGVTLLRRRSATLE